MRALSFLHRGGGRSEEPSRRALVVTVGKFRDEDAYPWLPSTFEDGREIRDLLKLPAAHPFGGFEVEWLRDATWSEIEHSIEEHLTGARAGDTRLLFLSTHADLAEPVRGDKGPRKVHFVASDTMRSRLAKSGVAVAQVAQSIARCQASTVIVVVDTCYGGSLGPDLADEVKSLERGLTEELRGPADQATRSAQDPHSSKVMENMDKAERESLGYRGHSPTFIVLASCRATELAAEGRKWRPSEFTRAFVESVSGGAWVNPGVYAAMFRSMETDIGKRTPRSGQQTDLFIIEPENHEEGDSR